MKKFKGNLQSFSKPCNRENSRVRWVTFKDGDLVPEEWEKAVRKQGGKVVGEDIPDNEKKPESKEEGLSEESKKKLEDVKEDLKDDGKLNHSNNPKKKSPGRKKKVKK